MVTKEMSCHSTSFLMHQRVRGPFRAKIKFTVGGCEGRFSRVYGVITEIRRVYVSLNYVPINWILKESERNVSCHTRTNEGERKEEATREEVKVDVKQHLVVELEGLITCESVNQI